MEEHRAALQYDLRTRLGISVEDAGDTETWQDMLGFVRVIRSDPGSQTAAAIEGWEYPVDRMDAVMRDLFDLQYAKTGAKNRKPYDRPWKTSKATVSTLGDTAGRTNDQTKSILRPNGLNGAPGGPELEDADR